jgi:hypothetical protein
LAPAATARKGAVARHACEAPPLPRGMGRDHVHGSLDGRDGLAAPGSHPGGQRFEPAQFPFRGGRASAIEPDGWSKTPPRRPEITSLTPGRPRARTLRRKAVHKAPSSESPTESPSLSRRPSARTPDLRIAARSSSLHAHSCRPDPPGHAVTPSRRLSATRARLWGSVARMLLRRGTRTDLDADERSSTRRRGRPHCGSGSVEGRNRVARRYGRPVPRAMKVSAGGRRGEQGETTMRRLGVGTLASAALRPVPAVVAAPAAVTRRRVPSRLCLREAGQPITRPHRQARSGRLERRGHRGS